jgi:hypothetical protein
MALNAEPSTVSVVIRPQQAAPSPRFHRLRNAARGTRIIVVDDDRPMAPVRKRRPRRDSRAASVQQGNGASVKSGIRKSHGEYVHRDRRRRTTQAGRRDRLWGRSASTNWWSARAPQRRSGSTRRIGKRSSTASPSYLTERDIPDLTSGFRAARREHLREFLHMLPNGFSTPTPPRCVLRAGYNVTFYPIQARQRTGVSKIRLHRDGRSFC